MRIRDLILCIAIATATAAPAAAQRLFARVGPYLGELDTQPSRLGSVAGLTVLPASCTGDLTGGTWSLDYGRQLAWTDASGALCLGETATGRVIRRTDIGGPLAASTRGFGVISGYAGDITLLSAPDGVPVRASVASRIPQGFGWSVWLYAVDAAHGVALVLETDFNVPVNGALPYPPVLTRLSMRTGAIIDQRVLPNSAIVSEIALNAAGDRLAMATMGVYGSTAGVHVLDIETLQVLASNTSVSPGSAAPGPPALAWTDDGTRLLVVTFTITQQTALRGVLVLDGGSLAEVGPLGPTVPDAPPLPGGNARWASLSLLAEPVTGRALVMTVEREAAPSGFPSWVVGATLNVFDVASMGRLASVDLRQPLGDVALEVPGRLFVVSPPERPSPAVQVTSHTVALSWPAVAGADYYVVSAGSAPGLGDLASFTTAAPGLSVGAVPPGRYHVRVRAVGAGGPGPWSGDLVVVVP